MRTVRVVMQQVFFAPCEEYPWPDNHCIPELFGTMRCVDFCAAKTSPTVVISSPGAVGTTEKPALRGRMGTRCHVITGHTAGRVSGRGRRGVEPGLQYSVTLRVPALCTPDLGLGPDAVISVLLVAGNS